MVSQLLTCKVWTNDTVRQCKILSKKLENVRSLEISGGKCHEEKAALLESNLRGLRLPFSCWTFENSSCFENSFAISSSLILISHC